MNKVIIMTDSTCDLSEQMLEEYDIKVIPLYVLFGEEQYRDLIDLKTRDLYNKVESTGIMPKTSAISPETFIKEFRKYVDQGYDVFYTGISSQISSTFNNARIAAMEFPEGRVAVVDSLNLSTGIGILLLKACKFRQQGLSLLEIKTKIENIVPRVKVSFVVKNLNYLHKGGRCSGTTKFFGTMLRIKLRIDVRDGKLLVGCKTMGVMKKAVANMTQRFIDDIPNCDKDFVFITESLDAEQSVSEIEETLRQNGVYEKFGKVFHTQAGCVISSHCGPGTIGMLYIVKDEKDVDIPEEVE